MRTPRGRDILAACGQLKSESEKLRARAQTDARGELDRWTGVTSWNPGRIKGLRSEEAREEPYRRPAIVDAPRQSRRGLSSAAARPAGRCRTDRSRRSSDGSRATLYRVQPDEKGVVLRFGAMDRNHGARVPRPPPLPDRNRAPAESDAGESDPARASDKRPRSTTPNRTAAARCSPEMRISSRRTRRYSGRSGILVKFLVQGRQSGAALSGSPPRARFATSSAARRSRRRCPNKRQQIADRDPGLAAEAARRRSGRGRSHRRCSCNAWSPRLRSSTPSTTCNGRAPTRSGRATRPSPMQTTSCRGRAATPSEFGRRQRRTRRRWSISAQGEANAFLPLLASYEQAKDVTAWRLYLDSIDAVLKHVVQGDHRHLGQGRIERRALSAGNGVQARQRRFASVGVFAALANRRCAGSGQMRRALIVALLSRGPRDLSRRSLRCSSSTRASRRSSSGSARRSRSNRHARPQVESAAHRQLST